MGVEQDVKSFLDLVVWHRAVDLSVAVYEFTRVFPKEELFGLRSQLQRAAVSVPSNIAEGQTQLLIAKRLGYGAEPVLFRCESLSNEVERMLNGLMRSLGN